MFHTVTLLSVRYAMRMPWVSHRGGWLPVNHENRWLTRDLLRRALIRVLKALTAQQDATSHSNISHSA